MEEQLITTIHTMYDMKFVQLQLLRDCIGKVYLVTSYDQKYVLKIYQTQFCKESIDSVEIMSFLYDNGIPVPEVIRTVKGELYFTYEGQIAVLQEYIDGQEVERGMYLKELGEQYGKMRRTMEKYTQTVNIHDKEYFILRYLNILRRKNYAKADMFEHIGNLLWKQISGLPKGFIHGDFHAGNLFLRDHHVVIYDFDACSFAFPVYDIATICDATDYFSLEEDNFTNGKEKTQRNLEMFLSGYESYYPCSKGERDAVFASIALRHFDIQATIIERLGLECVNDHFLDEQLIWLQKWMS